MLTLIRCPFHSRVAAVARKRPRSFCQKGRWQVIPKHAYILDPTMSSVLTTPLSRHSMGTYLLSGNEFTRNLSGNIRAQSSQLAKPLWTDFGIKSGISVRELNSTQKQTTTNKQKKKKKSAGGKELSNILPKSSHARKKPPPPPPPLSPS